TELEVIYRNGLRLGKLVNTLLDFSRIQAGRMQARYEPLDLGACTAELASVFRSAIERAGLRFEVNWDDLGEPVYLDREMWEKVVLNLLSNALKFTFDGRITVTVRRAGESAVVTVADTGTGIPAEELPRLFERFHRIRGARARSHEGSSIGLALVAELVALHGGTITTDSTPDVGTTFTITLPLGSAHLP
ncbi:MAG: HAMP domain-containing histidine kinase, partial [Actinomycetota bacterium]|nr:HAMP domain-containing histidine kinase [Actinomycetota bacterium]